MSRKIAKQPRKFGRRKVNRKSIKKTKHIEQTIKRISDDVVALLDEIYPDFVAWYRENYRDDG